VLFYFLCRLLILSRTSKGNKAFEKASEEIVGDAVDGGSRGIKESDAHR